MKIEGLRLPTIIQGGMGVAVSDWRLASAVSRLGQLGVVSGTGLDTVLSRRLQKGDPDGLYRRAFDAFPVPEIAERVWDRYFVQGGIPAGKAFKSKPLYSLKPPKALIELTVVANFVEVFLAKLGHEGGVGINLLEKIQLPTVHSLFGAMLAGVDYVLMGAGVPRQIPGILNTLSEMRPTRYEVDVAMAEPGEHHYLEFDPLALIPNVRSLKRPNFLAIVSSSTLAQTLARKCDPPVDGFIVEGPTAGGHNAPPRGAMMLDDNAEPIYGPRDVPDLAAMRELGLPFWLAGAYGDPQRLEEALAVGATGIQVGTAFAFCEESGIDPSIKARVLEKVRSGEGRVHTDALASPTKFPFKVLNLEGTLSDPAVYESRERICDLGYLRQAYRKADGSVGFRCPAEPQDDFVAKQGNIADTEGRKCICNGLLATIGLGQVRRGVSEPPIVTAGDDVAKIGKFVKPGSSTYTAADVLQYLLSGVPALR